jgi:hypothetical protein
MSDIAQLISRLASMNDGESGSGGGGGDSGRIHPGANSSGAAISNLNFLYGEPGSFTISSKAENSLEDVFNSKPLGKIFDIEGHAVIGELSFDALEKFMPVAIRSKLAVSPQKNFLASNLKPPHISVGGIKSVFGKRDQEQGG